MRKNGGKLGKITAPESAFIHYYSFFPDVSPGFKIIESPVNLVYLPLLTDTISNLNLSITDQDDNLLNLRDEKLTARFHIREAR